MPNSIADNLQRLQNAKTAIGNAITTKGGTVSVGDGLEDFATAIGTIPTGDDSGHFIKEALPIKFTGDGNNLSDYVIYGKQGGLNGVCPNIYTTINNDSLHRGYWGEWYTYERYLPDEPCYNRSGEWQGLCNEIYLDVGTYTFSVYVKTEDITITNGVTIYIVEVGDFPKYAQAATVTLPGTTTPTVGTTLETVTNSWQRYTFTFDITVAGYVAPRVEKRNGDGTNIIVTCYQLEKGSSASPYVAYNTPGITINVNGSNIFFPLDEPLGPDDTLTMADTGVSIATVNGVNTISTPIVGGFDMKINGGISSLVLGTKTINSNGTYQASTDNNAGYTEVSVNVPNSYVAGDEGKVVYNGALVAQTAYPTEIKENDTYDTTNYNSITVNLPTRGYNHGGVNFFDIDGTVLYSYTKAEFSALTEMPPNPDRTWDWLVAQGWNWTLADAKTYVAAHGALNIGQHYITPDNKTALNVILDEGCLNPQLGLYVNGTVVVEWGDETSDTITGTGTGTYKYVSHTYAEPGQYYILLTVTGSAVIKNKQKLFCKGGLGSTDPGNESKKYINCIQDIHLGANIDIGSYAFYRCYSLRHISIPMGVSSIGTGTFQYCTSLDAVVVPHGIASLGTSTFEGCYGLKYVSLPKTITSAGTKCFSQCYSMIALTCPESLNSIGTYCFGDTATCDVLNIPGVAGELPQEFLARNRAVTDLVIPEGVTSIGVNGMDFCYGLKNVSLPSTLKSAAAYAFSNCGALNEITFPNTFETFGDHTFYKDTALQHFTFPTSVTAIPASMFEACHSLSYIVIPYTITSIGAKAFSEGYGLTYIKFEGNIPPTIANANAFSGLPTDCKILVQQDCYDTYTSAADYPSPATYEYAMFYTYASGRELPNMVSGEKTYDLTWYASINDLIAQSNPITEGNGKEVYAHVVERV